MAMKSGTGQICGDVACFTPTWSGLVQRKCACGGTAGRGSECEECGKKRLSLQRRSASQAVPTELPPIVHEVLRSPGQPLDPSTRAYMESRFGHDFGRVRVHRDAKAAESADSERWPTRWGKMWCSGWTSMRRTGRPTPATRASLPMSPAGRRCRHHGALRLGIKCRRAGSG
jgi:hypothetical protein